MNRYTNIAVIFIIISFVMTTAIFGVTFLSLRGSSCTQPTPTGSDCTLEQSQIIADNYMKKSSTFKFDGLDGSIKLMKSEAVDSRFGWTFEYTFQTRHPGHGDRAWQVLAQVITDHTAIIEVRECRVVSATCDNTWDLKQDKPLR